MSDTDLGKALLVEGARLYRRIDELEEAQRDALRDLEEARQELVTLRTRARVIDNCLELYRPLVEAPPPAAPVSVSNDSAAETNSRQRRTARRIAAGLTQSPPDKSPGAQDTAPVGSIPEKGAPAEGRTSVNDGREGDLHDPAQGASCVTEAGSAEGVLPPAEAEPAPDAQPKLSGRNLPVCPRCGGEWSTYKRTDEDGTLLRVQKVCLPCAQARLARHREKNGRDTSPEEMRKQSARKKVENALKAGTLTARPCERCGAEEAHAHHENYDAPLDVIWLCPAHHKERHREMDLGIPFAQNKVADEPSPASAGEGLSDKPALVEDRALRIEEIAKVFSAPVGDRPVGERALDLYASDDLSVADIAKHLGAKVSDITPAILKARDAGDARIEAGDILRGRKPKKQAPLIAKGVLNAAGMNFAFDKPSVTGPNGTWAAPSEAVVRLLYRLARLPDGSALDAKTLATEMTEKAILDRAGEWAIALEKIGVALKRHHTLFSLRVAS